MEENHTFVVCAYGESPFLGECLKSLFSQTVKTNVLLTTSTPSDYLMRISNKYGCPLIIRSGEPNIADDWNFAISSASTPLVTIAHQDDVYSKTYVEQLMSTLSVYGESFSIYFTDYGEIRNGKKSEKLKAMRVKNIMLKPLLIKSLNKSFLVKRGILSLGNPICCPSVTYNLSILRNPLFRKGFRSNLDWDAWERFAHIDCPFLYNKYVGVYHRVHEGSETSACIIDNTRTREDLEMLERFWPKSIAKLINKIYKKAQSNN